MNDQMAKQIVSFARKYAGLSRRRFGELFGVNGKTVFRWERGETSPAQAVLIEIAALASVLNAMPNQINAEESDMMMNTLNEFFASIGVEAGKKVVSKVRPAAAAFIREWRRVSKDEPVYSMGTEFGPVPKFAQKIITLAREMEKESREDADNKLAEFGPLFADQIDALQNTLLRAHLKNMVGVGLDRDGDREGAMEWFQAAAQENDSLHNRDILLQSLIASNIALLWMRDMQYGQAEAILSTAADAEAKPVLYNWLCLASLREDPDACRTHATTLFERYPELSMSNPKSHVHNDPMLKFYRSLVGKDAKRSRRNGPTSAAILVAALTAVLVLAEAVSAGMSGVG